MTDIPLIAVGLDDAARLMHMPKQVLVRAINAGDLPAKDLSSPESQRRRFSILVADLTEWHRSLPDA